MKSPAEFTKPGQINPRTHLPREENWRFYKDITQLTKEDPCQYLMLFAPRVLGAENIPRLEKGYHTNLLKEECEYSILCEVLGGKVGSISPNFEENSYVIRVNGKKITTTDEKVISVIKLMRTYDNRKRLFWTAFRLAIENEFWKNRPDLDFLGEKRIDVRVNGRKHSFIAHWLRSGEGPPMFFFDRTERETIEMNYD